MTLAIKEPKPPKGKVNSSKKLARHAVLPLQKSIKVGEMLAISSTIVKTNKTNLRLL